MSGSQASASHRLTAVSDRPVRVGHRQPVAILLLSLLIGVLSGCTYEEPEVGLSITPTSNDPVQDPSGIADSNEPTPSSRCQGGPETSCLGPLPGGTYSTSAFQPAFSFTVPEGWTNLEDEPGNFMLNRKDDSQIGRWGGSYVGIYQNVRAAALCKEEEESGVGPGSGDLVAWYRTVPGLEIVGEAPASVGGLNGVTLDLRVREIGGVPVRLLALPNLSPSSLVVGFPSCITSSPRLWKCVLSSWTGWTATSLLK